LTLSGLKPLRFCGESKLGCGVKTRFAPNIDRWKNTIRLLATFGEFANVLLMADLGIIFKAYYI
jgi:hypothetical protein